MFLTAAVVVSRRRELPFIKTAHLSNPWNEHKPVKIGRDGQVGDPPPRLRRRFTLSRLKC